MNCNTCNNCLEYKKLNDEVIIELEKSINSEKELFEMNKSLERELKEVKKKLVITQEKFDILDQTFQKLKILFNNFLMNTKSNTKKK